MDLKDYIEVHLKSFKGWHDKPYGVGFWIALVVSIPFWLLLIEPMGWVWDTGLSVAVRLGLGS